MIFDTIDFKLNKSNGTSCCHNVRDVLFSPTPAQLCYLPWHHSIKLTPVI